MDQSDLPAAKECQVCFTNTIYHSSCQTIIKCQSCKRTCHRYCYLPSVDPKNFICDGCRAKYQGKCCFCQNYGLLKKIGHRFAHPLCLLFNPYVMVSSFSLLTFVEIEKPKINTKKLKCSECLISNWSVMTCQSNCSKAAHIYCAFKSYDAVNSKGWRPLLQMQSGECSNGASFHNSIERYVKANHSSIYKTLHPSNKPLKLQWEGIHIVCEEHNQVILDCNCKNYQTCKETNMNWVYCDSCSKWSHRQCLDLSQSQKHDLKNPEAQFICKQCRVWRGEIMNQQPKIILSDYPKMQVYDYIFMHKYLQEKKYELPGLYHDFLFKIRILPGVTYTEQYYKQHVLVPKLENKIAFSKLQSDFLLSKKMNLQQFVDLVQKNKTKIELIHFILKEQVINHGITNSIFTLDPNTNQQIIQTRQAIQLLRLYQAKYYKNNPKFIDVERHFQNCFKIKTQKENITLNVKPKFSIIDTINNINKKLTNKNINEKQFEQIIEEYQLIFKNQEAKSALQKFLLANTERSPIQNILKAFTLFLSKTEISEYMQFVQMVDFYQEQLIRFPSQNRSNEAETYLISLTNQLEEYIDKTSLNVNLELQKEISSLKINCFLVTIRSRLELPRCLNPMNNLSISSLNSKILDELIESEQKKLFLGCKQAENNILKLIHLSKICQRITTTSLTKQSFQAIQLHRTKLINSPQYSQLTDTILQQFIHLYQEISHLLQLLQDLVNFKTNIHFENLIDRLKYLDIHSYNSKVIHVMVIFFKNVQKLNLDLFNDSIKSLLKIKAAELVQKISKRRVIFENQIEFQVACDLIAKFNLENARIDNIIKKDEQINQKLLFRSINFDNPQTVELLEDTLSEVQDQLQKNELDFRIPKIKTVHIWIDLYKAILTKISAKHVIPAPNHLSLLPIKQKAIYFSQLEQILSLLRQTKFPECYFQTEIKKIYDRNEKINNKMTFIRDYFKQESQNSDTDKKIPSERQMSRAEMVQFLKMLKQQSILNYELQIIDLETIVDKFDEMTQEADHLLQAESQNNSFWDQLKFLLDQFSRCPIQSDQATLLQKALENRYKRPLDNRYKRISDPISLQKNMLVEQNSESFSSMDTTIMQNIQKMSVDKISTLVSEIECSKKQYYYGHVVKLANHICKNSKLSEKNKENLLGLLRKQLEYLDDLVLEYQPIIAIYKQRSKVYTQEEITQIASLMKTYQDCRLRHQQIQLIQLEYYVYDSLLPTFEGIKEQQFKQNSEILQKCHSLSPCFLTPQIIKSQGLIQKKLTRLQTRAPFQ